MAEGFSTSTLIGPLSVASFLIYLFGDVDTVGIERWTEADADPRYLHLGACMALLYDGDEDERRQLLDRLAERPELAWLEWADDVEPVSAFENYTAEEFEIALGFGWPNGHRSAVVFGGYEQWSAVDGPDALVPCGLLDVDLAAYAQLVTDARYEEFGTTSLRSGLSALRHHLRRLDDPSRAAGHPTLDHQAALLRWLLRRFDVSLDRGLRWHERGPSWSDLAA